MGLSQEALAMDADELALFLEGEGFDTQEV